MEYTKDQQKVIDTKNKNILVSAAAGSGKTAVLTERIVRKICDDRADIGHMLIVTFTNSAASEMRDRIGRKLRNELSKNPGDDHIRKQITILHTAKITTIDSFCLYLVRNHFEEIGLDPSFGVASGEDTVMLSDEAFDEVLEEKFEEGDERFLYLVECYAPKGKFGALKDVIGSLAKEVASKPFMKEWIEKNIIDENTDISSMKFMEYILNYENALLQEALKCYESAERITENTACTKHNMAAREEKSLTEALIAGDFDFRTRKLSSREQIKFQYGNKQFSPEDALAKDEARELIDRARGILDKLRDEIHDLSYEKVCENLRESFKIDNALLDFLGRYLDRFSEKKREKNLVDFSDMEHFALEILIKEENGRKVPTETALAYRDYFDEIMIDEYQDSNEVQEILLSVISREYGESGNRFMVGDIKQSIYGFRLARPEIFAAKYEEYDADKARNEKIDLSANFRSRKEVIDAVNAVFEKCMNKEVGGVSYNNEARLVFGAAYYPEFGQDEKAELLYFNPSDNYSGLNSNEYEARMIGARIRELVDSEFLVWDTDKKIKRPVKYSDIAILLRATKGRDTVYQNELKAMNIPAHVISKNGYFSATEVKLILQILQIIDNPRQDLPLFAVMHSYIGGFSDEEMAKLRIKDRRRRLYDSVCDYAPKGDGEELKNRITGFLSWLEAMRKESLCASAADMIEKIYADFDYPSMVQSLPNGDQRLANIRLLADTATDYEAGGIYGIHDFIKYVERMVSKEVDMGEANILDENSNVVKIMTIHKSKGLEFPVCFVANLSARLMSNRGTLVTDDELGVGGEAFNVAKRTQSDTLLKKAIKIKKLNIERGELIRIYYVAMTRACEKLILTGSFDEKRKADSAPRTVSQLTGEMNFMNIIYPTIASSPDAFSIRKYSDEDIFVQTEIEETDKELRRNALLNVPGAGDFEPYIYDRDSLDGLFTKTTVSELKKAAYLETEDGENTLYHNEEKKIPKFVKNSEEEIGGASRGTAYHRVMELMDFKGIYDGDVCENLRAHRKKMADSLFIEENDDKLVAEKKILDFLNTEVSHRMSTAASKGLLYLEQPFVLSVSADKVNPQFPKDESILVQGVIDVYFEEEGELVLLDYKTDRVSDKEELIKRYKTQLDYYKEALSRLENKPVKEVLIYSFSLGEVIEV